MHDAPHPPQIIDAVREYLLDGLVPGLNAGAEAEGPQGAAAYHARVAAGLLAVAQRELAEDPAVAAAERARLQALLATPETDLRALTARLCERIDAGECGLHTPALLQHLWQTTLAKMAVDNPRYDSFVRCVAAHTDTGAEP